MAKKKEPTIEEKLRALYDLQLIDSRIDQIRSIRGELPLEVEDLENEIEGLNKRLEGLENEITERDVVIVAGFQGVSEYGEVTTLGRGGSDTTAVAIASALKAKKCEIYTCLLYTSPSPRDVEESRMPSSA